MNEPTIIATILVDDLTNEVVKILPGVYESPAWVTAHLTEDHIDTLLQLNQAYYMDWLKRNTTNFPIV